MKRRTLILVVALGSCALAAGCTNRNPDSTHLPKMASPDERQRTIAALRPSKRRRPVIAVLGDNRGSETTDLLVPYAVLKRSLLAEVTLVAPEAGPIQLMPALRVEPQATIEEFEKAYPNGADYVILPAFHHDEEEGPILDWIISQAAGGATIVGICAGAKVLGRAGLLDGRKATSHWYDVNALRRAYPTMSWVRDRRYVVDRGVVTTTGVTASLPVSLALVEAIGGKRRAEQLAAELGVDSYEVDHSSEAFGLTANWLAQAASNSLAVWSHETIGLPVTSGVDEIALAFAADAWSRTYRSMAVTTVSFPVVTTREGLSLLVDVAPGDPSIDFIRPASATGRPAQRLDDTLAEIAARYGDRTAAFVALQLEYAWPADSGSAPSALP
jgi:putative intracellular protease/amidase